MAKKKDCTTVLRKGYDVKMADPGTVKKMRCDVCKADMAVSRGVNCATSFAEAMGRHSHMHDRFECPNAGKKWHEQAIKLMELIEETPSQKFADMLEEELKVVLREEVHTKAHFSTF